jgi:predicted Na+-dependent transporter
MAFAVLSVVAGAPFVATFTKLAHGDVAFAGSMSLILMLVTIPVMPLVLPWMLTELHVVHPAVTAWHLLKPMLWFIVLPLAIGVAVRWRHPTIAQGWSPHCMLLALLGIAVHVTLMFVAFWNQVVAEVDTGEYLYSIFMPIGCLIVGYGACLLFTQGAARAAGRSTRLPAALGTAQKGSLALICSLIFAMGKYPVAGVVALGSSVITIVILVLVAAEIGRRAETGKQRDRERIDQPAPIT